MGSNGAGAALWTVSDLGDSHSAPQHPCREPGALEWGGKGLGGGASRAPLAAPPALPVPPCPQCHRPCVRVSLCPPRDTPCPRSLRVPTLRAHPVFSVPSAPALLRERVLVCQRPLHRGQVEV